MRSALLSTVSFLTVFFIVLNEGRCIELGEPAPALIVDRWVKGEGRHAVFGKETNTIVLLFWETWCDSCMASLPQMIDLHKRTKEKGIVFLSICAESPTNILNFLENDSIGKRIEFPVAADKEKQTFTNYMAAFSQTSVPYAFIIDPKGTLVWRGHPLAGLAATLDAILTKKFDVEMAKKVSQADRLQKEYFELVNSGTNSTRASEMGRRIVRDGGKNPWLLNNFAWKILTAPTTGVRDFDLAVQSSRAAFENTGKTNASFADTYAKALFNSGKKAEAIAVQKQAINLLPNGGRRLSFEQTLKIYEADAAEKSVK